MKLKYKFVVQEVSDGFVAVAVGADAAKFSGSSPACARSTMGTSRS